MAFKNGLVRMMAAATLLVLLGCGSASDSAPTADTPAAQAPEQQEPPTEAELEAAQADWEARQNEVNQVLASIDRATFIGTSPTKGDPTAEVVVVKFSDFECPFCAVAAGHMKDFVDERGEEVLYVYKHLPLKSIHPEAEPASKASWAAAQQDQFWLYHNGLFANQDRLGDAFYGELAEQIGLDVEQFNRDRNSDEAQAAIDADLALAEQLKLQGTPSFLMGGLLIPPGIPPESFGELLDNLKATPTP
ncbi:thioredoxin domain-containing protein [Leptolyngbya cf. ectocarpi LEGE 11479]|uniref:Thioredoxin domain-containing protein n=1 Tax=Leptolyngbya cf. ectocarpi LEGE 11479 TaxID=1828722 RepID=A0A928ZW38_LEPEC|nr:thioredoxin domain-containing protein [Leptolyngbya ectocarpi]MBE9068532.1 thioredoxin domain-containing protein [Leptolyngbya cf. ectocarpi LEGE 11479]